MAAQLVGFNTVSPDALRRVCDFCDDETILRSAKVCKAFKQVLTKPQLHRETRLQEASFRFFKIVRSYPPELLRILRESGMFISKLPKLEYRFRDEETSESLPAPTPEDMEEYRVARFTDNRGYRVGLCMHVVGRGKDLMGEELPINAVLAVYSTVSRDFYRQGDRWEYATSDATLEMALIMQHREEGVHSKKETCANCPMLGKVLNYAKVIQPILAGTHPLVHLDNMQPLPEPPPEFPPVYTGGARAGGAVVVLPEIMEVLAAAADGEVQDLVDEVAAMVGRNSDLMGRFRHRRDSESPTASD